jgi:hypothetical protein
MVLFSADGARSLKEEKNALHFKYEKKVIDVSINSG